LHPGKGWYWLHQSLFLAAYDFETQTTTVEGDLLLCSEREDFDKDENDKMEILFSKQMIPLVVRRSEMYVGVEQYILSRMLSRTRINYHNYRSEKIIIISDTMAKRQQTDTMTIK
jgi:hypothetical protein